MIETLAVPVDATAAAVRAWAHAGRLAKGEEVRSAAGEGGSSAEVEVGSD